MKVYKTELLKFSDSDIKFYSINISIWYCIILIFWRFK